MGKYEIRGTVLDENGQGVEGAAVKIGNDVVYSGADGTFEIHVKNRPYSLIVLPEKFLIGEWKEISGPSVVSPEQAIQIIVRRIE
jgi:uncharacterized membrane protein